MTPVCKVIPFKNLLIMLMMSSSVAAVGFDDVINHKKINKKVIPGNENFWQDVRVPCHLMMTLWE